MLVRGSFYCQCFVKVFVFELELVSDKAEQFAYSASV